MKKNEPYFIITGAANGIGKSLAFELARYGKNLLLIDLNIPKLELTVSEFTAAFENIKIHHIAIDLTESNAIGAIRNYVDKNELRIQGLVNNAGIGCLQSFISTGSDQIKNMLLLNNLALTQLTHEFLPDLRRFKESFVLNVGSILSHLSVPNKSIYCASKSFVLAFSRALYFEERENGIHVSCLCPGSTITSNRCEEIRKKTNLSFGIFNQYPDEVSAYAIRKLFSKKFLIVPGLHNKFLMLLIAFLPASVKRQLIYKIFTKKQSKQRNYYLPLFSRLHMLVRD